MYDDDIGDLVGELVEEIGRRGRQRRQARRAGRRAGRSAKRTAKAQTKGRKLQAGTSRDRVMGLGAAPSLAAGASTILQAVVQKPIQINRLLIQASAAGIVVRDIKIGVASQLTTIESLPAEAFGPTTTHVGVQFDPAPTGITISISLTNLHPTDAISVSAMAFGIAAD